MIVRAAIALAGLSVLAACATPGAPVAVPASAPVITPTEVPAALTTPPTAPVTSAPPAKPVTTTKTVTKTVTGKKAPVDGNAVVGPFGWQTLSLGMSPAEAEALGMATPVPEGDDLCQVWPALGATALERIIVHPVHGVFAVHPKAVDWITTPEGMHVGWTAEQVAAAYPDFDPAHLDYAHGPTVTAPGNPDAVYRLQFDDSGVLARFLLERQGDLCST